VVTVDFFEDNDDERALFVQHSALEEATHLAMSESTLKLLSQTLHDCPEQYRDKFFLVLTVDPAAKMHSSDASAATQDDRTSGNKRRLSKAEKKKLSKQKTEGGTSSAVAHEEVEETADNELVQGTGDIRTSPMSLLFACSATTNPEETTMSFAAHLTLLTSPELYESLLSIL
jgi:hypothetical protein